MARVLAPAAVSGHGGRGGAAVAGATPGVHAGSAGRGAGAITMPASIHKVLVARGVLPAAPGTTAALRGRPPALNLPAALPQQAPCSAPALKPPASPPRVRLATKRAEDGCFGRGALSSNAGGPVLKCAPAGVVAGEDPAHASRKRARLAASASSSSTFTDGPSGSCVSSQTPSKPPQQKPKPKLVRIAGRSILDVYGNVGDRLHQYRPQRPSKGLEVYALPLKKASADLLEAAERTLHAPFDAGARACISGCVGARMSGITTRSGRTTAHLDQVRTPDGHWLLWEESPLADPPTSPSSAQRPVVGAMLACKPVRTNGLLIEYVVADRARGGKGWPMVCALENVCSVEGVSTIFSAANLARGMAAFEAHARWGFTSCSLKDWSAQHLAKYNSRQHSVVYMRKVLEPP